MSPKNPFSVPTAAVAAAIFINVAWVTPALAQKAALVQDTDEPARTPYQQQIDCIANGSNICRFTFQAVPAGHRREIRLVSCTVQARSFSSQLQFQFAQLISTAKRIYMTLPIQPQSQNVTIYNGLVYAQTSMFFEAGDVPFIQIVAIDLIGASSCLVTGRDIAL